MTMSKSKDRVLGALLGVAVGDALGVPIDFMSAEEIQAKHGGDVREMIGGGWLNVAPGEISDDTEMTLAVAEGIAENPSDPFPAIGRRFIEWYDSKPKDIGNCCRAAIAYAKADRAKGMHGWHKAARRVHEETGGKTAGNGALMRTIYPPLWYGEKGVWLAEQIGQMTHTHKDSCLAIRAYSEAVAGLISDDAGGERMKRVREIIDAKNPTPDGYVINSLACAVNAVKDTSSFEEAVVRAVNFGGDADTIGAITGGLAGALYGASVIPHRWTDALDRDIVQRIEHLAEQAANKEEQRS
jgi:ADP-ribosyl-[dinitrogen reductase] hydrolase